MADNQYVVEYAKSGRAKCRNKPCGELCAKDELRVGKVGKNWRDESGDSTLSMWYHPKCYFQAQKRMRPGTKKVESTDDLAGFDDIKDDDKELIKKLLAGEGVDDDDDDKKKKKKAPAKKKATKRKKADSDNEGGDDDDGEEPPAKKKKTAAPKKKKSGDDDDGPTSGFYWQSTKFWEAKVEGTKFIVRFGKLGAAGRVQEKDFSSEEDAQAEARKMIKKKIKGGYELAADEAAALAAAGTGAGSGDDDEEKPKKKKAAPKKKTAAKKKKNDDSDGGEGGDDDAAPASSGAGEKTYLVADSSSGGKFWECTLDGKTVTTRWGKVDTDGQSKSKTYKDEAAARKDAEKQIAGKEKKGYERQ